MLTFLFFMSSSVIVSIAALFSAAFPGFSSVVFSSLSIAFDSCTCPHKLSVGCVCSIILCTDVLPTCAPDSIVSVFVSYAGACVMSIVYLFLSDSCSLNLFKESYIISSLNSFGVSNGVGFDPPNPTSCILSRFTHLPSTLVALDFSISSSAFVGSQFPFIAYTGAYVDSLSKISTKSSSGPNSVTSPVMMISSKLFSSRYSYILSVLL